MSDLREEWLQQKELIRSLEQQLADTDAVVDLLKEKLADANECYEIQRDDLHETSEALQKATKLLGICKTMNFGNWDYDDMARAIAEFFAELEAEGE